MGTDHAIACTSLSYRQKWQPWSLRRARLLQPLQETQALRLPPCLLAVTRSSSQILGSQDGHSFLEELEELDNLVEEVGQAADQEAVEEQAEAITMSLETPEAR